MPKYCSVPNCENDSTSGRDQKSFYKFPLHDPEQLQLWLRNIGRDNWTPSRHHYVCHEHFVSSCFKVHVGIPCLESDAVPTVFRRVEKRKVTDDDEKYAKVLRRESDSMEASIPCAMERCSNTDANLPYLTALPGVLPLLQPVAEQHNGEWVLLPSNSDEAIVGTVDPRETHVIAYLESIPNVVSGQLLVSSETVLSSALSSEPITSTLPIVSKHAPPRPSSPSMPLLAEGDELQDDDLESWDHQLEEHCYHKHRLNKEQLEAVVAELQKKVKVLHQRHRRHLNKMLGLENTVSQLRQKNMMTEERLQLLERAYLQNSADTGETVAIIYEEDDAAFFYTLGDSKDKL
ncbi:THAP domain-containing protein 5-like [Corythoichthys intestinalis]|uniref:THAP domain-containing protein 5-like n=1 Tax=Corythoichthys intestinalis TaxID=161448 RepID=UPI0025A52263|nr:THAP domain-containing protein 5-like [Corythoichthys intestinalis]